MTNDHKLSSVEERKIKDAKRKHAFREQMGRKVMKLNGFVYEVEGEKVRPMYLEPNNQGHEVWYSTKPVAEWMKDLPYKDTFTQLGPIFERTAGPIRYILVVEGLGEPDAYYVPDDKMYIVNQSAVVEFLKSCLTAHNKDLQPLLEYISA